MGENLNPPLSDFSTQQARADELRRRKLRVQLRRELHATITLINEESIAAIRTITDEEWAAAQAKDDEATNAA